MLQPIVLSWAKRYYYSGLGKAAPQVLPDKFESMYNDSFKKMLIDPASKIAGHAVKAEDVPEFFKELGKLQIESSLYLLTTLANQTMTPGADLPTRLAEAKESALKGATLAVAICGESNDILVYKNNTGIVGVFPYNVTYLYDTEEKNIRGRNTIEEYRAKSPMLYTDKDIAVVKNISIAVPNFVNTLPNVDLEVFKGGRFVNVTSVDPTATWFPPYEFRKLYEQMPTANPYRNKHEQIWNYIEQKKDEYSSAYAYLEPIMKEFANSSEQSVTDNPDVYMSEDFVADKESTIEDPNSGQAAMKVGDYVQYCLEQWEIPEYISVRQFIDFMNSEDDAPQPWCYSGQETSMSVELASYFYDIMEHYCRLVPKDYRALPLSEVMTGLRINRAGKQFQLRAKSEMFESVARLFMKMGADPDLSLQDMANKEDKHKLKISIPSEAAKSLVALGIDPNTSLAEILEGKAKPVEKKVTTYEELYQIPGIDAEILSEIAKYRSVFTSENIPEEVKANLIKAVDNPEVYGTPSLIELLKPLKLPDDLLAAIVGAEATGTFEMPKPSEEEVKELMKEYGFLESKMVSLTDEELAARRSNDNIMITEGDRSPLEIVESAITKMENAQVSETLYAELQEDFGFTSALCILKHIREELSKRSTSPKPDQNKYRVKLVPIYYAFIRMLAIDKDDKDSGVEFLQSKLDEADPEVKFIIEDALSKIK